MPVRAGKLRHRVKLQSFSAAANDYGEVDYTAESGWSTADTLWAEVKPLAGRERIEAQQVTPEVTTTVMLRHRDGITPEHRFLVPKESTTLGAAVTTTDGTSITLAAAIPNSASTVNIPILIDSEIMLITAGHGTTTATVTRGAYGTTAATHSNGATVLYHAPLYIESVINHDERDVMIECMCKERP